MITECGPRSGLFILSIIMAVCSEFSVVEVHHAPPRRADETMGGQLSKLRRPLVIDLTKEDEEPPMAPHPLPELKD